MWANFEFTLICAVFIHPVLLPGRGVDVTASGLTCPFGSTTDDESQNERPLEKKISTLANSAKRSEPLTASGDIFIRMDPESLYCYEREELIILETFVTLWWNDKLICWDPAEFDNVNNVTVKVADLWMPQLISYTKSIEVWDLQYLKSECTVYSNGTVRCLYLVFFSGMCNMRLRDWPTASEADCWISVESYNPTGRQRLLHRDNRTSKEWMATANVGNVGQFVATQVDRQAEGNGVVYRFRFQGNTVAFGHALRNIAGVLSVILVSSFGLPAGSVARISLLGCVCVSLILSIGFLGGQLSAITPDTPDVVRIHGDILIVAAVALLPATLLAPHMSPTKPYMWQLSLRSWLLSSSVGRFLLSIFFVSSPANKEVTTVSDGDLQRSSFQKEDSDTFSSGEVCTRLLLFTLFDRALAVLCFLAVLSLWVAMYFA